MRQMGWNRGFIDELYERFREDPASVGEAWREFFADYVPHSSTAPASPPRRPPEAPSPPAAEPAVQPLTGITARIVDNMVDSLKVPTATSVRTLPTKLLEENRRLINQSQAGRAAPKISFTHLLAWAVVRALVRHPAMNAGFVEREGRPHRVDRGEIRLGLAIDVERRGERVLLVPNIPRAETLDFPTFVAAYNDLIGRARNGKLTLDDFEGTTVTLTNPGMIGTEMSVPRLMAGQGTIVGIGAIDYPAEYRGVAADVISELGVSKVMTVTSTYDHRVIQGAESGAFLAFLESLVLGQESFFRRIFDELDVPHEPVAWSADSDPVRGGGEGEAIAKQARVIQMVRAYRVRGHLLAHLDPLGPPPESHPELELSHYGLTMWDLDRRFMTGLLGGVPGPRPLRDILDTLRDTYCREIGVEFMHIQEPEIRTWLYEQMEATRNAAPLAEEDQRRILSRLNAAEAFEKFLHTAYIGHKRFSLEGAESLIPMLDMLFNAAAAAGVEESVIGMTHRGRLNVLANIIGKSFGQIFREFEGDIDPETIHGSGDVKYHLGARGEHAAPDGGRVRLEVASNPSHLEAVSPVVEGMARARQDLRGEEGRAQVLPLLIHGDAALAGQGVVAETLNASQLSGYRTGGTVHVVVNNQIGFTTSPTDARSSRYPTDVAKMVQAPIFHVNGDHPEAVVRTIRLALAFRQRFARDVVVDMFCYRRWGHNEADDPSYTNPELYAKIDRHRSVRKLYTEQLLRSGDIDVATAESALEDFRTLLREAFDEAKAVERAGVPVKRADDSRDEPPGDHVDSTVERPLLERVLDGLERRPEGFTVHAKLEGQLTRRRQHFEQDKIDWATAEALAFGSLVLEGTPVRLSGEDTGRGTFSQRHAVLYDQQSGARFVPLSLLDAEQARFAVFDSHLSEFAVLGFEYGYSVDHPECLVLWEAQFGDFSNGAQVIIDQFVASAEDKWGQKSGLVMLLPHGYEGQGPEHSSARLERFLQLAADRNLRVVYPSTPAQYFHLLRRQASHPLRKPLVVMTPKSLLRLPACVSPVADLTGGGFSAVIDDPTAEPERVRRLVLCSGKVYYDLLAARDRDGRDDVALARVELLYPYPRQSLAELFAAYAATGDVVWAQEEPRNMGAWGAFQERLQRDLADGQRLRFVGRPRSASPATGSHRRHMAEQKALVAEALEPAPRSVRPLR